MNPSDGQEIRRIHTQVESCFPAGFYGIVALHVQNGKCQFVEVRQTFKRVGNGDWKAE